MIAVNIYEAKSQLSRLVASVEMKGERVVLCRNGTPVADIVPHQTETISTLEPAPELLGATFLIDPTAALDLEDWPEEMR
jgi:antitoxin (DNA-binding transcriptional repressor) of toxin-antitoxin stability system